MKAAIKTVAGGLDVEIINSGEPVENCEVIFGPITGAGGRPVSPLRGQAREVHLNHSNTLYGGLNVRPLLRGAAVQSCLSSTPGFPLQDGKYSGDLTVGGKKVGRLSFEYPAAAAKK